jgi:hypothetical protein
MYEKIERITSISVARGVGFATLTVFCFMVGFTGDTVNMLRSGGFGAFLIALTLLIKALNASPHNYRRTEVWIMLDEASRPPADVAARMVTEARRSVLLRWSYRAAWTAAFFLGAAVLFMLGHN